MQGADRTGVDSPLFLYPFFSYTVNTFSRLKHFLGILVAVCFAMPLVIAFGFMAELGLAGAAWAERLGDRALSWGKAGR